MKVTLHNEVGQRTYKALKNLVDNSWYMQDKIGAKGDYDMIREFCTIKMQTARQTGHSTAIARLCCEYFNNAILISSTARQSEHLLEKFIPYLDKKNITSYSKTHIEIKHGESNYYFFGSFNPSAYRGIDAEAIFVDCASFLPEKNIQEVAQMSLGYVHKHPFFLILVQ